MCSMAPLMALIIDKTPVCTALITATPAALPSATIPLPIEPTAASAYLKAALMLLVVLSASSLILPTASLHLAVNLATLSLHSVFTTSITPLTFAVSLLISVSI